MQRTTSRFVLPETTLLITMCMLDMFYTLYVVRTGMAKEANPILADSLAISDMAFLLLKGASFLVPVFILELIRPKSPTFALKAMRFAVVAYALFYVVGVFSVHVLV